MEGCLYVSRSDLDVKLVIGSNLVGMSSTMPTCLASEHRGTRADCLSWQNVPMIPQWKSNKVWNEQIKNLIMKILQKIPWS